MAEIIQRELDLGDLSLPSGTPEITATALSEGLAESLPSNILVYSSEYLTYYLKSDGTYEVTGIKSDYDGIESIVIPSDHSGASVTSISAKAFQSVETLQRVMIPRSITKIGANAFEDCINLASITIEDDTNYTLYFRNTAKWKKVYIAEKYADSEGYKHALPGREMTFVENDGEYDIYSAKISKNDLGAISFNDGSTYSVDIYHSDIRNSACWQMEGRIPKSYNYAAPYLLSLGQYAFANTKISTIDLPSTVSYISAGAFSNSAISYIEIPNTVRGVGEYAFSGCNKLKDIIIPYGVTSIGNNAFEYTGIGLLYIPQSVTSMGGNMCSSCESLTSVIIEGSGTIGEYAFYGCKNLTNLDFTDSSNITFIGNGAFGNTSLPSVEIPASVTWIGKGAFYGIDALEGAIFKKPYGWFKTTAYGAYDGEAMGFDYENVNILIAIWLAGDNQTNLYRLEQMVAPTITLDGAILTVTDYTGIADSFNIYVDGTCKAAIDAATGEVELK